LRLDPVLYISQFNINAGLVIKRRCPKRIFDFLDKISSAIRNTGKALLFLDYDGTLSPIPRRSIVLERPLDGGARGILERLLRADGVYVFIISGRSIDDLRRFIGLDNIYYIGVHGHVIEGPGIRFSHCVSEEYSHTIRAIRSEIEALAGDLGVVIEDKGIALSIHYRGIGREKISRLSRIAMDLRSRYPEIRVFRGRTSLEVLPNSGWDKGMAVAYVISRLRSGGLESFTPIYFGDDRTDERSFSVVRRLGFSARVGYRCGTNAEYYVDGVGEVYSFLSWLSSVL
jgi:trehalose-phosphatase